MRPLASCLGCKALVVIGTYDRLPALCVPTEAEAEAVPPSPSGQPIGIGIGYHNCPRSQRRPIRVTVVTARPPS
jgi:hypothetical protein